MAARMTTYNSRASVKARKVSDKDGETVVTSAGPVRANKGDYVVQHADGGVSVSSREDFEATWKAASTRQPAKKGSRKPAQSKTGQSSAARVRAAKTGSRK